MGARKTFSREGHFFPEKKVDDFLVVALKTRVLTVTANTQNTLNIFRGQFLPLPLPAGAHALTVF